MYQFNRASFLILVAALLLIGAPLRAQPRYQVIDLGTLGGNSSFALDVNIKRQVTGNARTGTTTLPLLAYLWDDGVITNIGVLPGSNNFSRGYGINDLEIIVGESDNNASMAFRWEDGAMSNLGTLNPAGGGGVAHGINNRDQIVGGSSNGLNVRPFLYEKGVMRDLGTALGTVNSFGRAWAINEHGVIAGVSRNASDSASQATLWSGGIAGTIRNLGSLGDGNRFSEAFAVSNKGWAVGYSIVSGSTEHAFLWREGMGMQDLGTLGFNHSRATDVNSDGQVVGFASTFANFPSFGGAGFIWENGTATDLNKLIPPDSGWSLLSAEGINENGDIVGFGTFSGQTRAFLLTPIDRRTYCSQLGDDRKPSLLDQDVYEFRGLAGEQVAVKLYKWPGLPHSGDRASIVLVDNVKRKFLLKIDSSALPSEVKATLPATGDYRIIVGEQLGLFKGRSFRGGYCVQMKSTEGAALTLEPTAWVEEF
jgi:probable HAF family extracellular repeat protein